MALAGVLSAIRTLILDGVPISAAYTDRLHAYAQSFPALSASEVEDLAKIPPEKLQIYSRSIFSNERGVLRSNFPVSFSVLKREHERLGLSFEPLRFVRELHARYPWKGNSTEALALNFVRYLGTDCEELRASAPYLPDLALLEYFSLLAARGRNDRYEARDTVPLAVLSALTVEELLACPVFIPSWVRQHEFSFDVLSYRRAYYAEDRVLPDAPPEQRAVYAIGGRSRELATRWIETGPPVFAWFSTAPRSTPLPLSSLAESWVEGTEEGGEEMDEQPLFQQFFRTVIDLSAAGAIVIPPPA